MIYDAPDWCPPFGIPRPALPPDTPEQDALCAIRAAIANAHHDLFDDATLTTTLAASTPGTMPPPLVPVRSRSSTTATSAGLVEDRTPWTMWSDARL